MPLLRPNSNALRVPRRLIHPTGTIISISSGSGSGSGNILNHSPPAAFPSAGKAVTAPALAASSAASFSSASAAWAADHAHGEHEDQYDPPTGWLWGVRPGEKYQKEGWEGIWVWGFFGSLGLGVVGYAFKPDTSIQTWALEEARRRLEVEGILKEPDSKS